MVEFTEKDAIDRLVEVVIQRSSEAIISNEICFLRNDESGTGIFAKSKISANSVLVRVPFKECISLESVVASPLHEIIDTRPGLLDYQDEVIALGLMYAATAGQHVKSDATPTCPWIFHLKTIPTSYNTPIYWLESELNELKGCNVYHLSNLMKKQIAKDWEELHKPLSEEYPHLLEGATIELYQWALSTVYSRAVGFQRNGKYTRCIPPIIDLANHNPDAAVETADTLFYDENNDTLSLLNNKEKSIGDECCAVYGTYPNSKLLYSYGFILPNCPTKAVDLWTRVTPSISNANVKQEILQSYELTKSQNYDFDGTIRPGYVSPALLATIRVIQAEGNEEMENIQKAFIGEMVSVRNEKAAYTSLRNLLLQSMRLEVAAVSDVIIYFSQFCLFCMIQHNI